MDPLMVFAIITTVLTLLLVAYKVKYLFIAFPQYVQAWQNPTLYFGLNEKEDNSGSKSTPKKKKKKD